MAWTKLSNFCIWPYKHLYVIYRWISQATNLHQLLNISQENNEGELLIPLLFCIFRTEGYLLMFIGVWQCVDGCIRVESHQICVSSTTTVPSFQSVTALAIHNPTQGFCICWMPEYSTAVQHRTGREAGHWNKKPIKFIFKIKTITLSTTLSVRLIVFPCATPAKTVVIFMFTPLSKEIIMYPKHR